MRPIDDMIAELELDLAAAEQKAAAIRAGINALCAEVGRPFKYPGAIMPTSAELDERD